MEAIEKAIGDDYRWLSKTDEAHFLTLLTRINTFSKDRLLGKTVAEAVGHINNPKLQSTLLQNFSTDSSPCVREAVARAAGHINDPKLQSTLLKTLSTDSFTLVRAAVAEAAGHINNPKFSPHS